MYYALDIASGQHVHASIAQRYRRYVCPHCRAQVNPRKGIYRDAHFAHAPGQGSAACEEFHPSDGWHGPLDLLPPVEPTVQVLARPRLSLSLQIQAAAGRTPASWGLEVLVPKAPSRNGTLTFDGGGDGFRVDVACAKLHQGAQRYRVNPDADSYRVSWASGDVDRGFALAVQERIPGPDPALITTFSASRGTGKDRVSGLDWGNSYYMLHRADRVGQIPADIVAARLADLSGWCCSLVTLPPVSNDALALWLKQATGLAVSPAKRQWAVALPAVQALDPSARLVLDSTRQLLLAVHPGDRGPSPSQLRATADGEEVEVELQMGTWNFLRVSGFSPNLPPTINVDGHLLPELLIRSFVRSAQEVLLQFGSQAVAANSSRAGELLGAVRVGEIELSGIAAPSTLAFSLLSRGTGELDWIEHPLTTSDGPDPNTVVLTDASLDDAAAIVRNLDRDVVLDFGSFGYWWSDAKPTVADTASISPSTRLHARWVLSAAGRPASAARRSDRALAAEIMALAPPDWLVAHHRLAVARVQREGSGS